MYSPVCCNKRNTSTEILWFYFLSQCRSPIQQLVPFLVSPEDTPQQRLPLL